MKKTKWIVTIEVEVEAETSLDAAEECGKHMDAAILAKTRHVSVYSERPRRIRA